jgi:hypothetical protein
MCLYVDKRRMNITGSVRQRHAFVADRPLVVFKRLVRAGTTSGVTPYQAKVLYFGHRHDITDRKTFDIYNFVMHFDAQIDGGGFHAVMYDADESNCNWRFNGHSSEWYPAIIPTGTKFFIGNDKDIVARSLIVYRNMRDLEAVHGKMSEERKPVEIYSKRAPR